MATFLGTADSLTSNSVQYTQASKTAEIANLNGEVTKQRNQLTDAKALLTFYLSDGMMDTNGTELTPKPVPMIAGSSPLTSSDTIENRLRSVSTPQYLDHFFPDNRNAPEVRIRFYEAASGRVIQSPESECPLWPRVRTANVITVSGNYWYATLKGMERKKRVVKLRAALITLKNNIAQMELRLGQLGVQPPNMGIAPDSNTPAEENYSASNNYSNKPLQYNVGMVNEAYFSQGPGFDSLVNMLKGGNKPAAVTEATQLWKNSQGNKGMIWLFTDGKQDEYSIEPKESAPAESTKKRYAFQFHYNPSSVDMAWAGSPQVDISMEAAGLERFDMLSNQTMSTITFDLVINRIFDMQYYGTDGTLKPSRRGERNPYSPKRPDSTEQKRIYNYGTMYDIEYLLSTILGYKIKTRFRGTTSDIGFLTGRPVDLHLGHTLRYWGYISSMSVRHVIFDERMVPIFSTMSISFSRIPDYKVD